MIRRVGRWFKDMVKGLGALAGLLLLLIGPPVALAHFVGWPLPSRLPGFNEVSTATRGGIDDMVIVKVLATLAWVLWAQVVVAALVEVAALAGRRAPRRAPVLPGLQIGVGRLVATAALIVAGLGAQRTATIPMAHLVAVVAQPPTPSQPPPESLNESPPAVTRAQAQATSPGPGQVYLVKKNDSWWRIAQTTLGDGQRWKEVRALNIGRTMTDGTVIAPSTEIIMRDWQILVPGSAAPVVEGEEVAVQRGDNLWQMAERHLQRDGRAVSEADVRGYWEQVIEANRDRFADAADPNRIYTGQLMAMPALPGVRPVPTEAIPQPPPAAETVPQPSPPPLPSRPDQAAPAPTTSAPPAPPRSAVRSVRPDTAEARTRRSANPAEPARNRAGIPAAGVLGAASTMLAVGIASVVTRRRRRRLAQLPPRSQPPVPPPELDELRAELVADGDLDHADRLQRALRDIATALAEANSEARPRLVQVTGRRVEAILSQAVLPAPPGWKAEASGSAWVLKGEPSDRGESDVAPNPALVTIGRPDSRTELYLDLEAEGVVALTGEAGAVAAVARSWVLELATSPLASGASVAVIGDHLKADWGESDRVRVVGSWEEIASDADAWVEQSAALLRAKRWATPLVGRLTSQRADDLAPLIIIAEHPGDERFETLCTAILEHQVSVVLVVVGGATEGATIVEVSGEKLSIPALGLTCQAQAVSIAAAEQVSDLIEDASRLPLQLSLIPVPTPRAPMSLGSSGDEYHDPDYEILVRLLGDITIVGGRKELKAKQTAVLAYIALQAPVASERVGDALWVAATESRRKRLANTVSECRNALGAGHLPLATDGRYRVGPGVVTDLELFELRLACALDQDDEAAAATLRGALELVEGPVFTYRNVDRGSYVWVDVENWISTWELKVTDTAENLAQRYLDLGDFDDAVWAVQRGLSASPTHTRLTKMLIKAYFAKGDARAAEQVFESHQAALEKLDLDDMDAELVDFYYDARRARAAAAS